MFWQLCEEFLSFTAVVVLKSVTHSAKIGPAVYWGCLDLIKVSAGLAVSADAGDSSWVSLCSLIWLGDRGWMKWLWGEMFLEINSHTFVCSQRGHENSSLIHQQQGRRCSEHDAVCFQYECLKTGRIFVISSYQSCTSLFFCVCVIVLRPVILSELTQIW